MQLKSICISVSNLKKKKKMQLGIEYEHLHAMLTKEQIRISTSDF